MAESAGVLLWGIIAHLVADWPLQTEWMAVNKRDLHHIAAWVHSGIHGLLMALIFPWQLALLIGISHVLIDTRRPVTWWMRNVKKMATTAPNAHTVEVWLDQVFHIIVLAVVVLLFY
ncbi:MAG: DUF3307 domain-containing protein [Caldilineaceae bacterium]|nr:DUF3307 domain-containing protein [Caldilineaceae bacterium]